MKKKNITVTTSDTKVKIVKDEMINKIIDVRAYAVENKLNDNSDKARSLVRALNEIDRTYGIVDVWAVGEIVVARIRGEL